jgi:hypothetical protein
MFSRHLKDVRKLSRIMAALLESIHGSFEKLFPFFLALKEKGSDLAISEDKPSSQKRRGRGISLERDLPDSRKSGTFGLGSPDK